MIAYLKELVGEQKSPVANRSYPFTISLRKGDGLNCTVLWAGTAIVPFPKLFIVRACRRVIVKVPNSERKNLPSVHQIPYFEELPPLIGIQAGVRTAAAKGLSGRCWGQMNIQHSDIYLKIPTRLLFKAVSDMAESNSMICEIAWDGVWVEGRAEMKTHLVVNGFNV